MKIQRKFIPGSKWLYFKVYTGYKVADIILEKNISNIIKKLKKESIIDKWFFIRYNDPDFHLRIRLLLKETNSIGRVINFFYSQLKYLEKDSLIWKIQIDTYNRELERYGHEMIELAESIFYYDSESLLPIISKLRLLPNQNYRWMIALRIIDEFLSDFLFGIVDKQKIMKDLSDSFKVEFGFNKYNSKQFNSKFRENKKEIESLLNGINHNPDFNFLTDLLKKRSKSFRPIVLLIKENIKPSTINLNSLISSYIHMTLNRLFRSKNRLHELVIYDFMYRYYTSEIAKLKIQQSNEDLS
uniref:thiopeptide-type bacteriocin biosynthesis protein n=1 Tax=uncultured Dysgonomonas sp. TaxID=206096 RepID=UPI0026045276|nr:thiopeptide-type bacteriocin biosynthesis protein [uncultured Dysgonomonas sp.]